MEHVSSIFRVEEEAKQETRMKHACYLKPPQGGSLPNHA
jgi:hypothetical protein